MQVVIYPLPSGAPFNGKAAFTVNLALGPPQNDSGYHYRHKYDHRDAHHYLSDFCRQQQV